VNVRSSSRGRPRVPVVRLGQYIVVAVHLVIIQGAAAQAYYVSPSPLLIAPNYRVGLLRVAPRKVL
jgi:hypothetical protein